MVRNDLDEHLAAIAARLDPAPSRDRRRHRRVQVNLSGVLLDHQGKEHPFDLVDVSAGGARICTAAMPPVGAKIVLYCESLGRLAGTVVRRDPGQLALSLALPPLKRDKLIETLTWLINKGVLALEEERRSPRFSTTGETICEMENGRKLHCKVLDMSLLGISLETAETRPHLGERVRVGRHVGTVARYTQSGFAIDFANGLIADDGLN